MNFGSWNEQTMEEKPGDLWKHSWRTSILPWIRLQYAPLPNQWRQYYDVPTISSSSSTATSFPVLPHPDHNNVHVEQPYVAIPDQIRILQSCWGRSAQHHSQGTPTSLYWPPWRTTPPSSPPAPISRTLHPNITTTPPRDLHRQVPPEEPGPMDMSDSSV